MNSEWTKSISIRPAAQADAKRLFQWQIDDELNQYDPKPLPSTGEELMEACESFHRFFKEEVLTDGTGTYKYYIIANGKNQPIGYINLFSFDKKKKEAELGIMMGDRNYQGSGVASFALNRVLAEIQAYGELERIYIETNIENLPAIRLFEGAGFRKIEVEDWGNDVFFQTMEKGFKRGLK